MLQVALRRVACSLELLEDRFGDRQELSPIRFGRDHVRQSLVDPGECGDTALLFEAEGCLRLASTGAGIESEAIAAYILIHELRGGLAAVGKQSAPDETIALGIQVRRRQRLAHTARQP